MKFESLILALSFILLIGIANAQNTINQNNVSLITTHISQPNIGNNSLFTLIPNNTIYSIIPINEIIQIKGIPNNNISLKIFNVTPLNIEKEYTLNNQTSCNFVVFTISTNANVMKCNIEGKQGVINASISFGKPLFFYYNASKNPIENLGFSNKGVLIFFLHSKTFLFPANSSILIAVYPNGSVLENNNLLYKFSKPQDEIGSYSIFIAGTGKGIINGSEEALNTYVLFEFYGLNASIMPKLNISIPNKNIVIGYEHGFDNLTITEISNDMLELIYNVNTTKIKVANSTSPLIYNVYNLFPFFAKMNTHIMTYPFVNNAEEQFWLLVFDKSFSNTIFHSIIINIFKPYLWLGNSKPTFEANVISGKVLEINFTNVNASLVSSRASFNFIFENQTIFPTQTFQGTGNLTFSMATNPNETEIINGNLIYEYGNKTYYYNITNLSLTQGQIKRIVISVMPITPAKPTPKCNIDLCILLILLIILLIIILWRIEKHLKKKKRKV